MRCVCCDSLIDDHATDQDVCYVCLVIIKEPAPPEFEGKSGVVRVLTKEEIDAEYGGIYAVNK